MKGCLKMLQIQFEFRKNSVVTGKLHVVHTITPKSEQKRKGLMFKQQNVFPNGFKNLVGYDFT